MDDEDLRSEQRQYDEDAAIEVRATERSEGGSVGDEAGRIWWVYTGCSEDHVVALLLAKFPGSFKVRQSAMREWYRPYRPAAEQ